ncbi:MAG TPA: dihydropteroate synthase [Methanoregula sp.]|nr:dihydropteroate synthase [Methanoregula sp.]
MQRCVINGITIGGDAPVRLMGVINCSIESFYNDSYVPVEKVRETAVAMIEQGADLIDLGARSTAPNSQAISGTEEARRIDEALKELDGAGVTVSVDTMNPWVLDVCLKHGIHAVNDISGLSSPAFARRIAEAGLPAFLMAAGYQPGDAIGLEATIGALRIVQQRCANCGIDNYVLDPGIGIWTPQRTFDDNWELCRHFDAFRRFERPLLAAISRKSFIGSLLEKEPADRLAGSLAVTAWLVERGASIVRTHDVTETRDVLRVCERIAKVP